MAALAAKQLLCGQRLVFVRAEELNIAGSLQRNKMLHTHAVRKRMNTNKRRGPFHFKAPSRFLFFAIRGMIPYKTTRGKLAMNRLQIFEGVPPRYQKVKLQVLPGALTFMRLKANRAFTRLGDLCKTIGWQHDELIQKLEAKRITNGTAYHKAKVQKANADQKKLVAAADKLADINAKLAKLGY